MHLGRGGTAGAEGRGFREEGGGGLRGRVLSGCSNVALSKNS